MFREVLLDVIAGLILVLAISSVLALFAVVAGGWTNLAIGVGIGCAIAGAVVSLFWALKRLFGPPLEDSGY